MASGMLALVYLAQQDVTRAESTLTSALRSDTPIQTIGQWLIWYARAKLAQAKGDADLALEIIDQLISAPDTLSEGHRNPRLSHVHGEALAALGRGAEAEAVLQTAQETARAHGLRPTLWRICIALGKFYQTQAREAEAEQAFSTARAIIEDLAANIPDENLRGHFLAQATALLPKPRARTTGRAARQAYGGLTPREVEVLRLVSTGLTNAQIAHHLSVTPRTVNAHLTAIYSKLGVASRSWAIRYALDHQLG
jgi:DNA-binding CsgD family transcriptional regulator